MGYHVELSDRAFEDLSRLYKRIDAENSEQALEWFEGLERQILKLDENPGRGVRTREDETLRQIFYGRGRNVYRVIYEIDATQSLVKVIHVRFGARRAFDPASVRK